MSKAIERASAENVEVETFVRCGVLREVLPCVVSQTDAATIIIGHLIGDPSHIEMDEVLVSMKE